MKNPEIVAILEPFLNKVAEFWYPLNARSKGEFVSVDPYIVEELYKTAEEVYQLAWEDGHRHNWEE